jgi:hypothetical protein
MSEGDVPNQRDHDADRDIEARERPTPGGLALCTYAVAVAAYLGANTGVGA